MSVNFSDSDKHWAKDSIVQLAQRGVVQGYPDGSFQPEKAVSRAEFAAFLQAAFSGRDPIRDSILFQDVSDTHWAFDAIRFAYQTGFVAGYPEQQFKPDVLLTRGQAIAAIASGLHYPIPQEPEVLLAQYFDDIQDIPDYATSAIAAATQQRLVVNYPQIRQLRPNHRLTRGELAALLCRALRNYSVPNAYIVPAPPSEADPDSIVIISPQFSQIENYSEGLVKVLGEKSGFLKANGQWAIRLQSSHLPYTDFSEGLAAVSVRGAIGYIDKMGEMVIPPQFVDAAPFQSGLASVAVKASGIRDKKYGYINRNGEFIVEPQFVRADSFEDGLARVHRYVDNNFEYGFIDSTGEMIIRLESRSFGRFFEGLAYFEGENRKYGFIDRSGNVVIQPQFAWTSNFSQGRAWVRPKYSAEYKHLCIDRDGHVITPTIFERVEDFSDGKARVCVDGECGYLSLDGEFSSAFNDIRPFSEALAAVRIGDKQGFIDRDDNLVIPAQYDVIYDRYQRLSAKCDFSDERALVSVEGKMGYIDRTGSFIIQPQFDWALPFSEGLAAVRTGDQEYYIDTDGNLVFYSQFSNYSGSKHHSHYRYKNHGSFPDPSFVNGLALMHENEQHGFVDKTGKVIIPPQFSQVRQRSDGLLEVNMGSERVCTLGGDTPNFCYFEGGQWGLLRFPSPDHLPLADKKTRHFL